MMNRERLSGSIKSWKIKILPRVHLLRLYKDDETDYHNHETNQYSLVLSGRTLEYTITPESNDPFLVSDCRIRNRLSRGRLNGDVFHKIKGLSNSLILNIGG